MDMDPSYNTRTLLEERRRWDLVHAAPLACKQLPPTNLADPKRRLRIGYVSADFKSHSAPKVFGAMLTSYSGNLSINDFFIPGVGLVVLNCMGAATATVIVRAKVNNLTPEILSFNRIFWLLIFFSGWVIIADIPLVITSRGFMNTLFAAILDPVLAILLAYKAYQYIEASRGTIIQSTKGLLIIPVAYFYFGTLPLPHQIAGGVIAMIGVGIIGFGQHKLSKKNQKV